MTQFQLWRAVDSDLDCTRMLKIVLGCLKMLAGCIHLTFFRVEYVPAAKWRQLLWPARYRRYTPYVPLPSNRHHWSNDDCLEGKRENYHVCSVQYCVQQIVHSAMYTHMNRPNSSLDCVLSQLGHFTRFIFVYVLHACVGLLCRLVTR